MHILVLSPVHSIEPPRSAHVIAVASDAPQAQPAACLPHALPAPEKAQRSFMPAAFNHPEFFEECLSCASNSFDKFAMREERKAMASYHIAGQYIYAESPTQSSKRWTHVLSAFLLCILSSSE